MKKTIIPSTKEEAIYYSDFTGKVFGPTGPEVNVSFTFNYGSTFDGAKLELDLTDEESKILLDFVKTKLATDNKQKFQKILYTRDHPRSTHNSSFCDLLEYLLLEETAKTSNG